jgi:Tfp pilus assembly protein PilN
MGVVSLALTLVSREWAFALSGAAAGSLSAMRADLEMCSEELNAAREESKRRDGEANSLCYPLKLLNTLGDALPAGAWIVRVEIQGKDVAITGNVAKEFNADELLTSMRKTGALASVRIESLKPMAAGDGGDVEFVVTGDAVLTCNVEGNEV